MKTTRFIKKLCVCVLLNTCFLQSMDVAHSEKIITLEIIPASKHALSDAENSLNFHGVVFSRLDGFSYDVHKMELRNEPATFICDSGELTGREIYQQVKEMRMSAYPLVLHKKIAHLHGNERLEIVTMNVDGSDRHPVLIKESIRKRLLHYLCKDISKSKRNSFDMCRHIALDQAQSDERINMYESLARYIDFVSEKGVALGDIIGLFVREQSVDGSSFLYFKNYSLFLGNGMCLSKIGGGTLCIVDLQSLKNFYECKEFARLDPAIEKRRDFVSRPFALIGFREIGMTIHQSNCWELVTECHTTVKHLGTMIFCLRCANKQVALRSDALSGTIGGYSFSSPKELSDILLQGLFNVYPLVMHKQLNYMVGDEMLSIKLYDKNSKSEKDRLIDIDLPFHIKKKLFTYLLHDTEDKKHNCFDFCKELCFNTDNTSELHGCTVSYKDQASVVSEDHLRPGDAIVLGVNKAIKHFAVSLGGGLSMSKIGNAGPLVVTYIRDLLDMYDCRNFLLLKPTILQYTKFLNDWYNNSTKTSFRFKPKKQRVISKASLHKAARDGKVNVVKSLVTLQDENGPLIDQQDNAHWTALSYAAWKGHLNVVKVLVEAGAMTNIKGSLGTPYDIAIAREHKEVADYLEKLR